jgi:hypothetical protein
MRDMEFSDLHDATLESVTIDWATGHAQIALTATGGRVVLIARGVSEFSGTRNNPWGPSVSINKVSRSEDPVGDSQALAIEMQSGDLLSFVARGLEVLDGGHP